MIADGLVVIGGIGLFLVGMLVLTEGLKAIAAGGMRRFLSRYTNSPVSGAVTGALTTAFIQSSSATTVTAVGFVGAGLLSFSEALGVIFGANIGTTFTGWLVVFLGFKLKLGTIALALLPIGALMRLFAKGRWSQVGWALVGFSLLFIGLDTMQTGASGFEGLVSPDTFPNDTIVGRLQLVAIGMVFTIITQSSSAGVATAMVAMASGSISFHQAAAMVIGMDVGTTFTAALATVGGSVPMRQTGYAHVIYNCMTGVMAFFLLVPYTYVLNLFDETLLATNPEFALALFHTSFNTVGVIAILPLTGVFANFIMRLVPEQENELSALLDKRLLNQTNAAADAAASSLKRIQKAQKHTLLQILIREGNKRDLDASIDTIERGLSEVRSYLAEMQLGESELVRARHAHLFHTVDHMMRLNGRCRQGSRMNALLRDRKLVRLSHVMQSVLQEKVSSDMTRLQHFEKLHALMARQHERYRHREVAEASSGMDENVYLIDRLDSMRWLWRVSYHLWRIVLHLGQAQKL